MPDVMVPSSDSRTRAGAPAAGRSSQVPGSGPCRSKRALHHSKQMFHLRLHPALPTLGLCVWTPMRRFIPKCSRFFADIGAVENAAINAHAFPQSQALLGQRVVELLKQSVPQAGGAPAGGGSSRSSSRRAPAPARTPVKRRLLSASLEQSLHRRGCGIVAYRARATSPTGARAAAPSRFPGVDRRDAGLKTSPGNELVHPFPQKCFLCSQVRACLLPHGLALRENDRLNDPLNGPVVQSFP
ncbi:MAG: hypothetical protein M2R45_05087 [Verrucomicrobia subdivision 3 bacterium]|nr:hypothetical protein [Limisphaerales bacterium]